MLNSNAVRTSVFSSALGQGKLLQPVGKRSKKRGNASLLLTSLVDSFAILVIFLMMNQTTSYEVKLDKAITLPAVSAGAELEKSTVLKIKGGLFFLNDEQVSIARLAQAIYTITSTKVADDADDKVKNQFKSLIVVADKNMDYNDLNPVIKAAAAAGVKEFKFAVLPKNK